MITGSERAFAAGALLLLIASGIAAYALFLRLFGVTGWRQAVAAFRRPGGDDLHL